MSRVSTIAVLSAIALAASLGALLFADDPAQRELGLRIAPFVTASVIVVHSLATLPLSMLIARSWSWLIPSPVLIAAGIGGIALTLWSGLQVGPWLEDNGAGFLKRTLTRTAWCVALQVPWCMLGWRLRATALQPAEAEQQGVAGWEAMLLLVIAIALPVLYVNHLTDAQAEELAELREQMRLARALPVVESICQLGREESDPANAEAKAVRFREVRDAIRQRVQDLKSEAAQPLPVDPDWQVVVQRAETLAQLDRLDEAEALLRTPARDHVKALLLLAIVLQDKEKWVESSDRFQRVLEERFRQVTADPVRLARATAVAGGGPIALAAGNFVLGEQRNAFEDCVQAYDGLAFNARGRRDFAEAERWYRDAIAKLPPRRAHFYFQLGRHFEVAGRPGAAVEAFREAARLDPDQFAASAEGRIRKLRNDTPACFLGGTPSRGDRDSKRR